MNHWILKSEPQVYSFADLVLEVRTEWTGIRNFEARNFLRTAKVGDTALVYHSGEDKALVGIAKVTRAARADPTAEEGDWVSIEIEAQRALPHPLTLATLKTHQQLRQLMLVTRSRLSVTPLSREHFDLVLTVSASVPSASTKAVTFPKKRKVRAAAAKRHAPRTAVKGRSAPKR